MAGGIIVLRVSEAVIALTLWELRLCWPVHLAQGALESFQQQQVNMKNQIKGGLPVLFVRAAHVDLAPPLGRFYLVMGRTH